MARLIHLQQDGASKTVVGKGYWSLVSLASLSVKLLFETQKNAD
jgi:hypothetical protein